MRTGQNWTPVWMLGHTTRAARNYADEQKIKHTNLSTRIARQITPLAGGSGSGGVHRRSQSNHEQHTPGGHELQERQSREANAERSHRRDAYGGLPVSSQDHQTVLHERQMPREPPRISQRGIKRDLSVLRTRDFTFVSGWSFLSRRQGLKKSAPIMLATDVVPSRPYERCPHSRKSLR